MTELRKLCSRDLGMDAFNFPDVTEPEEACMVVCTCDLSAGKETKAGGSGVQSQETGSEQLGEPWVIRTSGQEAVSVLPAIQ